MVLAGVLASPLPHRPSAVATPEPGQVGRSSLKGWSSGAAGHRWGYHLPRPRAHTLFELL